MEEELKPWERQPGESTRAYSAFLVYRDLGPQRSLRKASEIIYPRYRQRGTTGPPGRIVLWSGQFKWHQRAEAWDAYLRRLKEDEERRAIKEMAERHARAAVGFQQKALERLLAMKPGELKPKEVLAFFIEAAKLERLSRGEPTERTETQDTTWEQLVKKLRQERGLEP